MRHNGTTIVDGTNITKEERMRRIGMVLMTALCLGTAATAWGADGKALFVEKCAPCHGPKGEGTMTGPAQKGNPFIIKSKPAEIKQVIMEGRAAGAKKYPNIPIDMPKGLVSDPEADAIVKFMQGELQK
jgi:mono/diheme cytochrome c family protein